MSRSSHDEIVKGYIEEVRTYIPLLIQGIESLREKPDQAEVLEETHRLVHTIKGASAMVGISGLSQIANQMEDALDKIISGSLVFTEETFQAMSHTVGQFQTYCQDFLGKGVAAQDMLRETSLAFRRLQGLPAEEDAESLDQLLSLIPDHEAFTLSEASGSTELAQKDSPVSETAQEDTPAELDESDEALIALLESEEDIAEEDFNSPDESIPGPLPELLESFYEEAEEHLEDLGRSLDILESQVTAPAVMTPSQKEIIRQIRRSVHTLKGASAVVGIPNIPSFAHSAEDLLDWLYEEAQEITPEMVAILTDSADLLERLVANPNDAQEGKASSLKAQYEAVMGKSDAVQMPADDGQEAEDSEEEARDRLSDPLLHPTQTIRVPMERVDELVNLIGELIIATSAFDQKMETFTDAVNELELSRDRLRDIARDMEVGYEVRALEDLGRGSLRGFASAAPDTAFGEFDALELDRYSQLSLIIRTLNESVIDVGALNTHLANLYSDLDGHLNRQRVLLSELQDKMMRVRMTPMQSIANKLRWTVRDVSKKLEKKIRLVIEGADIELDRGVWEKITDPLMHLLRNAADHGIESPDIRQAAGKPLIGTIRLAASREGNQVVIRITDDGAGLDYEAIRKTLRRAKLSEQPDRMTDEELASFIFQPGFSSREQVSKLSGRGVGMDVVRENIHELKGGVRVASWKGKGTRFTIRIPLTLAAVRALLFTVGGQTFAIALNEVREIIRISQSRITSQLEDVVRIGDEVLPLRHLATLLNTDRNHPRPTGTGDAAYPLIIVLESGGIRGAMVIESLVGQKEIVIKSTGSHLRYVRGIAGTTIMGDGSVVPILNVEELLHTEDSLTEPATPVTDGGIESSLEIMVVDDSVSIRQVVSRLVEDQGWKVQTAKDGIEALECLRDRQPDLIVLDIEMPRMNGYEFLNAVKAQTAYRHIPVVVLTSRATMKHRDKALSLGARGFLVKPYDDDEFIDLVLNLTSGDV